MQNLLRFPPALHPLVSHLVCPCLLLHDKLQCARRLTAQPQQRLPTERHIHNSEQFQRSPQMRAQPQQQLSTDQRIHSSEQCQPSTTTSAGNSSPTTVGQSHINNQTQDIAPSAPGPDRHRRQQRATAHLSITLSFCSSPLCGPQQ